MRKRGDNQPWRFDYRKKTVMRLLRSLMRKSNMTNSDLGRILGDRTLGHKIVTGARGLSRKHIELLSKEFSTEPGAFLYLD